jgi:predicted polyphosphate/ATP-dependent NAD kinase
MGASPASTVGIIVNPRAGKDIRRLTSGASHTPDTQKIGILRRVAAGALEQGASRLLMSTDGHHLAERAVSGFDGRIDFVEGPRTGSHLDTIACAEAMWKAEVGAVVALGGDGTCRDVATGWPDVPLIAISTGTNNVFPAAIDGTAAGVAAALVATGMVPLEDVSDRSKRVSIRIDDHSKSAVVHEDALVEAALISTTFVGARAITDPSSVRWVVASLADPGSTGLSGIAGRLLPIARSDDAGVLIRLGEGGRRLRVPLAPGTFATLDIASVEPLPMASPIELPGQGVLAYDGERTSPVGDRATVTASIERSGPRVIDVQAVMAAAAAGRLFDVMTHDPQMDTATRTDSDGD